MGRLRVSIAILLALLAAGPVAAETIKLGVSKLASCAAVAIGVDKGYFAAEGLSPELSFFDAQQPIAVATLAGNVDIGIAAETAALYSLAGEGDLRVIAGGPAEAPSFHYLALLASNDAYAQGLTSPRALPGHSVGLTQVGTGLQYTLGLFAEKYGFDINAVRLLPLQSNSNIASALAGGRVDAAVFSSTGALPLLERGAAKLLVWTGDDLGRHQTYLIFASAKTANERGPLVERFLRAYRKAAREYSEAFADASGKRRDGPEAPALLAIIAKYLEQPVERVEKGLTYMDGEGRLDVADLQHQIDWYRGQGLIKGEVSADAIVDRRFVRALPPTPQN